jgi:hypothetical protein
VLLQVHQSLEETAVAFRREWATLEAERQRLSDWHILLEQRTKAESLRVASERFELEAHREDYKKDLKKVYDQELAAASRAKALKRWEEAVTKEEACLTEQRSELESHGRELEASSEALRKWRQDLEEAASKQALAEEEIGERMRSVARREDTATKLERSFEHAYNIRY